MNELGIVGTGLIGASIGLRARELGWTVLGFDGDPGAAQSALARGALSEVLNRDELYRRARTVVIAAPPQATIDELRTLKNSAPDAALIMDVASVKEPIVEAAQGLPHFVATHPLAGAQHSGPAAASASLFAGKPWLYVPPRDPTLERKAKEFISAMDAIAIPVDARVHDEIVALTSHLPQLFANLFAKRLRELSQKDIEQFCGPVGRELLRIGDSNAPMWREVFAKNAKRVAEHARGLAAELETAADRLMQESGGKKP